MNTFNVYRCTWAGKKRTIKFLCRVPARHAVHAVTLAWQASNTPPSTIRELFARESTTDEYAKEFAPA